MSKESIMYFHGRRLYKEPTSTMYIYFYFPAARRGSGFFSSGTPYGYFHHRGEPSAHRLYSTTRHGTRSTGRTTPVLPPQQPYPTPTLSGSQQLGTPSILRPASALQPPAFRVQYCWSRFTLTCRKTHVHITGPVTF